MPATAIARYSIRHRRHRQSGSCSDNSNDTDSTSSTTGGGKCSNATSTGASIPHADPTCHRHQQRAVRGIRIRIPHAVTVLTGRLKVSRASGLSIFLLLLWTALGILYAARNLDPSGERTRRNSVSFRNTDANRIFYRTTATTTTASSAVLLPGKLGSLAADYGGIEYRPLDAYRFAREINASDHDMYGTMRTQLMRNMLKNTTSEDVDPDDDRRYAPFDELQVPSGDGCYRLKWTYDVPQFGTCNEFHSLSFGDMLTPELEQQEKRRIRYLGRGSFRETWMLTDSEEGYNDDCVLKTNRYADHRNYKNYAYSQTRNEVLCMLKTHSSKRTMSIYGYCGTSMLVEPGDEIEEWLVPNDWEYMKQEDLDEIQQVAGDVVPQNNLTVEEKLDVAIIMAESIAEMHGNREGVIISHDIGFDQWLRSKKDGLIKLNDFNKARMLYWNPEENKYCKVYSHQSSSYRAPEEIHGGYIDDTADMVAFGKFLYTLLTGLRAYYDKMSRKKALQVAFEGEPPYIDPQYRNRSLIEGRLVEIMEQCWPYHSTDRVDIFTVVSHLRETAHLANITTH